MLNTTKSPSAAPVLDAEPAFDVSPSVAFRCSAVWGRRSAARFRGRRRSLRAGPRRLPPPSNRGRGAAGVTSSSHPRPLPSGEGLGSRITAGDVAFASSRSRTDSSRS